MKTKNRTASAWVVSALAALAASGPVRVEARGLRVSDNKRFLVYDDGTPFFYLGDTAWELSQAAAREDAELYLVDRAKKGFTVAQVVALSIFGADRPNAYGETPFVEGDPARPNEAYFEHLDWIVRRAEEHSLVVGLLPAWGPLLGGYLLRKPPEGGPFFTPETARTYGRFLGSRYRENAVIWVLGGDMDVPSDGERQLAIVRAMAAGLEDGDGGAHLKTFHPYGHRSSADLFHDEEWLDFNMIQSGHSPEPNHPMIEREYARDTVKPVMDAEARYERHPIKFEISNGRFEALDVRRAAYWSLFAGAFGHTYGCNDIWQFWKPGRTSHVHADMKWTEALDLPGAIQMGHAKDLILSRPFLDRIPDQSMIVGEDPTDVDHIQVTRGENGAYAFVYLPTGRPVTIDLDRLRGERLVAHWFDPRDGTTREIGHFDRAGQHTFQPPAGGPDWVLVLDDESMGWRPPGVEDLSDDRSEASVGR